MRRSNEKHVSVLFCIFLEFAGTHSHTFLQHLQRNVDEYRLSHFSWNLRNIDHDKYVSLRTIENNKDKAFREHMFSHHLDVKLFPDNEHVAMMYRGKTGNYPVKLKKGETEHPQMMGFKDKKGKHPIKHQKREAEPPQMMSFQDRKGKHPIKLQKREAEPPQMMGFKDKKGKQPIKHQKREAEPPQMMGFKDKKGKHPIKHQKREAETPQMMGFKDKKGKHPINHPKREAEPPQMMWFKDEKGKHPIKHQKREAEPPQMMGFRDKKGKHPIKHHKRETEPPQMMIFKDETGDNPVKLQKRGAIHPQMIIYKDKTMNNVVKHQKNEGEPPQKSIYDVPQEMMYGNKMIPSKLQQIMVYNEPQMMVYNEPLMAMYCDKVRSLNHRQKSANHPQMMVYNKPQMMMYRDKILPSHLLKISLEYPQMVVYTTPQSMRYNCEKDQLTKRSLKEQPEELSFIIKLNASSIETTNLEYFDPYRHLWFLIADSLSLRFPEKEDVYFKSWSQRIVLFNYSQLNRNEFAKLFPRLPLHVILEELSLTNIFQKLFWPFSFDQAFMNQKLALSGMSGISTNKQKQKERFYTELEKHQTIKLPVVEESVILSFDHPDLVEGLYRSGLLEMNREYVDAGNHLYTLEEQEFITAKVQAAMDMINSTNSELYRAIHQIIGCIAFYKAEHSGIAGGTISSALGVIWLDPRAFREQSVAHYAELIVHEFIHSSLFLADMVHGTYIDRSLLSQAKVYSPVREELRDFDKTFHASYVTTGVTIFQSRSGNLEKAKRYAGALRAAVDGLITIQNEAGVLTVSGEAMLQSMDDVLTLIRIE